MSDVRCSDSDQSKRDIPSFIEPRPPLILNPYMRPRPQKGTNLLELFDEDSECEEPEWVQVYLRLKPCLEKSNLYEVRSERCLITSVDSTTVGHGRRTQHNVSKAYTFSHIFRPESTQKEIFELVVKDNLKKLPEGHNFTLLTYGASGSGKTYTLMGTVQSPGLVPRSLEYVFRVVDAAQAPLYKPADGGHEKLDYYDQDYELQFVKKLRQVSAPLRDKYRRMSAQLRNDLTASTFDLSNRTRYYVWVSFVEIYNEAVYDLLSHSDRSKATSKLRIREDANGHAYVKGATQAFVRTGSEAYDVLVAGKHNLQVAATGVHANSSRSHCIFTITMLTETDEGVVTSCVRLCDLAGCERARHTRNTGARMQESRAINSSLHVLERCLHMLRRKQKKIDATLVPYRESKLTRLLGAGLSGSRGEAVSMVVTLNPSPQFAHETRHVLQLAAVARDIHVNQTIAESTLESSTQDSTVDVTAEVMKLRADNERLHFELVQAQAHSKELIAAMEEKQREVSKTMFEIVEEAKDMTKQYYLAQIQALKDEMEEMQDEYEKRLQMAAISTDTRRVSNDHTPSKQLQEKISDLMTENAILQEKLAAEKLARAIAEEEVQHLRACIDERDEKAAENSAENEEVDSSDNESDEEEENDIYKESLEPVFKKEDINRSRMLQRSLLNDSKCTANDDLNGGDDKNVTLKDDETINSSGDSDGTSKVENSIIDGPKDVSVDSVVDVSEKDTTVTHDSIKNDLTSEVDGSKYALDDFSQKDVSKNERVFENDVRIKSASFRGTYVVKNDDIKLDDKDIDRNDDDKNKSEDLSEKNDDRNDTIKDMEVSKKEVAEVAKNDFEQLKKSIRDGFKMIDNDFRRKQLSHENDVSLVQFEQLEKDTRIVETNAQTYISNDMFTHLKKKDKGFFFNQEKDRDTDMLPFNKKKNFFFDNIDVNIKSTKANEANILHDDRSPSIVKEDAGRNFEPSMITKLLGESFTRKQEALSSIHKPAKPTKQDSVDIFEGFDSPNIIKPPETSRIIEAQSFVSENENTKTDSAFVSSMAMSTSKDLTRSIKIEKELIMDKPKENQDPNATFEKPKIQMKDKLSIFDKCIEKSVPNPNIIEDACKSIENIVLKESSFKIPEAKMPMTEIKIKQERLTVEPQNVNNDINSHTQIELLASSNNTIENFENIYKDITAPRATEFELLVCQVSSVDINDIQQEIDKIPDTKQQVIHKPIEEIIEKPKYNLRHTKMNTSQDKDISEKRDKSTDKKSAKKKDDSQVKDTQNKIDSSDNNNANKNQIAKDTLGSKIKDNVKETETKNDSIDKNNTKTDQTEKDMLGTKTNKKNAEITGEILLESQAKCESKTRPKRTLRLRRQKNQVDEDSDSKLKDIVNLQKEFSDVTMDVPAPVKVVKDIESPEKVEMAGDCENLPPLMGIQSCPSKSVTRSRRKLFTPRAEPLEESMATSGDSNERVRVPRPSYHRTRARRKL